MTKKGLLSLQIMEIISTDGIQQREDFEKKTGCDLPTIERAIRDLIELEIINFLRGCGYVIAEHTTAFDVLCMIEEPSVMVEDNFYRVSDKNLTTILRGYNKLANELKKIEFRATSLKQIVEHKPVRYKRRIFK